MVIGPLRVTLENFRSIGPPVIFSVAWNVGVILFRFHVPVSFHYARAPRAASGARLTWPHAVTLIRRNNDKPREIRLGFQPAGRPGRLSRRTRPLHRARNQAA